MDQFVTTYRKDYLWPYVRTIGTRPIHDSFRYQGQGQGDGQLDSNQCCQCGNQQVTKDLGINFLGPNAHSTETWSRLAPTGPLLDPLLYPPRVGTAPEYESMRFNQPNVFLDKLSQKYPFLYEVLRTAPPDDIMTRINRDRLRSTYQVDFCNMNEYPSAPYDELLRAAGMMGVKPCSEPVRLPGDPCRPNQKPIAFRPATISKSSNKDGFGASLRGNDCAGIGGQAAVGGSSGAAANSGGGRGGILVPGNTEYQDAISKLGDLIIKDKIHYPKKATVHF